METYLILSGIILKSYHNRIQKVARAIEMDRKKVYTPNRDGINWSPRELHHIFIILGKATRLLYFMKDRAKANDEIIDIYNHSALLYEEVNK